METKVNKNEDREVHLVVVYFENTNNSCHLIKNIKGGSEEY